MCLLYLNPARLFRRVLHRQRRLRVPRCHTPLSILVPNLEEMSAATTAAALDARDVRGPFRNRRSLGELETVNCRVSRRCDEQ